MKHMRSRTVLLLVLVWVGIAAAIIIGDVSFARLQRDTTSLQMEADELVWSVVHELADKTFANHVGDYSYWDDMVAFAEGDLGDSWAEENIQPIMESIDLAASWVLDANGSLRYGTRFQNGGYVAAPPFPFTKSQLAALLEGETEDDGENYGHVREFYWLSDIGPLSVFVAEITTTDDPQHLKDARGYYVVATELSADGFLQEANHLGMKTTVEPATAIPPVVPPTTSSPHIFWYPLEDITGAIVGVIKIENATASFAAIMSSNRFNRVLTTGLWILTGIIVSLLVVSWGRTQQRANDLAHQMTQQLQETNETLERRVAERTKELADDIAQRKLFELQLEKRTRDLETMNRAMLDRESRVVELKHELNELKKSQQSS